MPIISTARFADRHTELTADAIRGAVVRFVELLPAKGVQAVRVWCSWNPDLPEDSPLQSPEAVLSPELAVSFLDAAVRDGVWKYADPWNRAGIDALDGSFTFLLGNDRDIRLESENPHLLDATLSAWATMGYDIC